ncbi:hypothetical protein N9Q25_00410 [bacterium]|nr:hypothetical protein [bacterium]
MKSNKVIAEFMGMTYGDPNDDSVMIQMTSQGNEVVPIESMKYHSSWDWLMPVVGKLLDLDEPASASDHRYRLKDALVETNIDSMYDMAVEFIKKHNDTVGDTNTMNSINITFGTKLTKDKFTSAMQRSIHHLEGVSWKVNWSKTIDKRAIVLKAIVNRYEGLSNLIPQLREDPDVAYVNIADDIDDILNENQIEEIINELITTWDT